MTRLLASAALLSVISATALAADATVIGDWLVKDGYANIRIDNCGGKMWGIVVWEKAPGLDVENPDPAKRSRPTLGMPVLMGLSPAKEPGKWSGEIYNSNNGKMYGANISLADENTLDLEGCLYGHFVPDAEVDAGEDPAAERSPAAAAQELGTAAREADRGQEGQPPAPSEVCLRVADEAAAQDKGAKK